MAFKPLMFVVMPFGRKADLAGGRDIDFDDIYDRAIIPSAMAADVEVVRADEERIGGLIHLPMYERLLLAEISVVDLTLANPNVLYELGVRHAARPRSTILIYHENSWLPFDVRPLRAIPYRLDRDQLSESEAKKLQDTLTTKLLHAKHDKDTVDSPLFQLLPGLKSIELPHEVTESFRERARYIDGIHYDINLKKRMLNPIDGVHELQDIEQKLESFDHAPTEVLVDLLLAYRDLSAWNELISLAERLPHQLRENQTIQEQWAMALNRRNQAGDRDEAITKLKHVIKQQGPSPETYGLLGRVYKDMFLDAKRSGQSSQAQAFLGEAIRVYLQGFEIDPRDFYPGINAATLLLERGNSEDIDHRADLLPVISFALARRGGLNSDDYWDLATILELAVHRGDAKLAEQAGRRLIAVRPFPWMIDSTLKNIKMLHKALQRAGFAVGGAEIAIQLLE